jgi:CRP-like cAMP-binding protein
VDVFQEAEMLRKVPFFGGLDPAKLKLLAFTSRAVRFAPGEELMHVGGPADSAYVVMEGEVQIVGENPAGEFIIGVLGQYALIGEMGVLTNAPRSTTVRAKGPVRALRISGEIFLRLLTDNPGCALHVMRDLSERVNAGNARLAAALREIESLKQQLHAAKEDAGTRAPT